MPFFYKQNDLFDDDLEKEKIYYIKRIGSKLKDEKRDDVIFKASRFNLHFSSQKNYNSNVGGRFAKPVKQSVVKMISNLNKNGTKNALSYILRNSEFGKLENENGDSVSVVEIMREWASDFGTKENSKDCWHLVFSIKEENRSSAEIEKLKMAVKNTMDNSFFGYKYALCIHNHQNNPHIHIVLNKRNIFDDKKIHFNSKDEIKDFFDFVRDDFTQNLNSLGFNYSNVNSSIKDLENEFKKVEKSLNSNADTKEQIRLMYDRFNKNTENEFLSRKVKEKNIDSEIEKLLAKKAEIEPLYHQYKKHNNKKYFTLGKELKELENEIKTLCNIGIENTKMIKQLEKDLEKVSKLKKDLYVSDENNYRLVRNFCFTFEKEFLRRNKPVSKSMMKKYFDYKRELNELGNSINGSLKDSVDSAVIYQKVFNKNENCFDIVKKFKSIDENLYIVKNSSSLSDIEKEQYIELLNKNKRFLFDLFVERYKKIKNELVDSKNSKNLEFLKKEIVMVENLLLKKSVSSTKSQGASGGKSFEKVVSQENTFSNDISFADLFQSFSANFGKEI